LCFKKKRIPNNTSDNNESLIGMEQTKSGKKNHEMQKIIVKEYSDDFLLSL
jgi:hypothetical protein